MTRTRIALLVVLAYFVGAIAGLPTVLAVPCTVTASFPSGNDDTAIIQAGIDSTPNGGTYCLKSGSAYRVEGSLSITGRTNFTWRGQLGKIYTTSLLGDLDPGPKIKMREQLRIVGGSNVIVRDLTIDSVSPCTFNQLYEGEAGVMVKGVNGLTLWNLTITDVAGTSVEINAEEVPGSPPTVVPSRNVTLLGGTYDCAGRQAIAVTSAASNITAAGLTIDHIGRTAVVVEMIRSSDVLDGFTLQQNTIRDYGLLLFAAGSRGVKQNITVTGNTWVTKAGKVKFGDPDTIIDVDVFNVVWTNNVGLVDFNMNGNHLQFTEVDGVTVSGNVQYADPITEGTVFVTATSSSNVSVSVSDNDTAGFDVVCQGC